MSRNLLPSTFAALAAAGMAQAEVPSVAADIAPVHSLVARVMEGLGQPDLIVPPGASPHGHSLRPSEAQALQDADLVFWIGPALTPWLADPIATLAPDAEAVELLATSGTTELESRDDALFAAHDHEGAEHSDETAGEHAEHGHGTVDSGAHAGHVHGALDPHAWLDPGNAKTWLDAIAAELSRADPDNAGAYFANAAAGKSETDALVGEIRDLLDPVRDLNFIVFHDAYQYFETAFEFPASGAISLSDAAKPGPARVEEIRRRVTDANVTCVLAEPQFNPAMVETVLDGTDARSAVIDPLGSALSPGPMLYPQLLRELGESLAGCL